MARPDRLLRNVGSLATAQAVTLGLNFLVWVHLSRVLTPDGFGVLTYGLSLLSYFLLAVTLGFDTVGIRELARRPERAGSLLSSILGLRLTFGLAATAAYVALVLLLPGEWPVRLALAFLGLRLVARVVQVDWVYQGLERMGTVALWKAATAIAMAIAAFVLTRDEADLVWGAVAISAPLLLVNLVLAGAYGREFSVPRPRFHWRAWAPVLAPALPLAAAAFVAEIYYNLDKVMLEWIATTTDVGHYGAAYRVYGLAIAPASVLLPAFFPSIASSLGDLDRQREAVRLYARTMLAFGVPIALAGPFLAAPLVTFLFGAEYAPAAAPLQFLFVNAGIVYVAMSHGNPITAWNRERPYMRVVLVGGVSNIVLNVLLISPFGTVGAAGATLATEALVLAGMAWLLRREIGHTHFGLVLHLLPTALACAGVAWATTANGWPLLLGIALTGLVWAVMLSATGFVRVDDVRAVIARRSPPTAPS